MIDKILVLVMKPTNILLLWVGVVLALAIGGYAIVKSFSAEVKSLAAEKKADRAATEVAAYSAEARNTQERLSKIDTVGAHIQTTLNQIIGKIDSQGTFINRNQRGIERLWREKEDK